MIIKSIHIELILHIYIFLDNLYNLTLTRPATSSQYWSFLSNYQFILVQPLPYFSIFIFVWYFSLNEGKYLGIYINAVEYLTHANAIYEWEFQFLIF